MDLTKITNGLLKKFDKCRLVFWQDEAQEFLEKLPEISTTLQERNVELIQLDGESHFSIKQRIELTEPKRQFLLYSNNTANEPTRDWLYDIKLFAQHFYADSSSLILNELGMRMAFRADINRYKRFFGSQQRYNKLKRLLPENADKSTLELAMLAVILKVDALSFDAILHNVITLNAGSPEELDAVFNDVIKYDLVDVFWTNVAAEFGYVAPQYQGQASVSENGSPGVSAVVKDLIVKLLITECQHALKMSGVAVSSTQFAASLSGHLLPSEIEDDVFKNLPGEICGVLGNNSAKRAAVVNFVSTWRESRSLSESYNHFALEVAADVELDLKEFNKPSLLMGVETFVQVEQQLLTLLAKDLTGFSEVEINDWVTLRLRSHWCNTRDSEYAHFAHIYEALRAAREFYGLREKYSDGFNFERAEALYEAYQNELYRFDHAYRIFCENSIEINKSGKDILKATGIVDDIENLYVNWYLNDLAIVWGRLVDQESLLENWKLSQVKNQQDFYQEEVRGMFKKTQAKRIFVIISDALRYEVAHDIHRQLNDGKRFQSAIHSQLGVVPSYTQLGMGSLLPHEVLTAHLGNEPIYKADGQSVHGHDNREKVLAKHNGLAFKAEEVLNWSNKEGREKVQDAEVVYIYHDRIDAIGDKRPTENQTFEAARTTVNDIKQLVARIINRLNGSRVIITADHGFLFKMTDVTDADKTALQSNPAGAVEAKKRYIIGSNLPSNDFYWKGRFANTAGIDTTQGDDAEFIVPRGSNRFNFVGGAKFIHGGIMPQEICVPVLHVRELHDEKAITKHMKQKVRVMPLHNPVKIVANIDRIQFLQTDAVGVDFSARELEIWIEDPDGNRVSGKDNKVLFNSESDVMEDRKRNVQIKLEGSGFERTVPYKLVMEDTENRTKTTWSVSIDLAFEDDFF